jgi:hypothetical protein
MESSKQEANLMAARITETMQSISEPLTSRIEID